MNIAHHPCLSLGSFTDWARYKSYLPLQQKSDSLGWIICIIFSDMVRWYHHKGSNKMWRWLQQVAARQAHHKHNLMLRVLPRFLPLPSLRLITQQEALHELRNVNGQGIQHLPSLASLLEVQQSPATLLQACGDTKIVGWKFKAKSKREFLRRVIFLYVRLVFQWSLLQK